MTDKSCKKIVRASALVVAVFALLPSGGAIASPPTILASTATLEKIRAADHERFQRIVIDTSDAVTFSKVEDESALTLALDGITSEALKRIWPDLGQVKGLRIEPISDTSVHVIFDLAGAMRPRISSYTPDSYGGHRIVIDLWPVMETVTAQTPSASDNSPSRAPTTAVQSIELKPAPESVPEDLTAQTGGPEQAPGLEEINQWPTQLDEVAKTIVRQETATLFPEQTTLEDDSEIAPDPGAEAITGDVMNGLVVVDPIAVARERLAQGSANEACKVLQVNYPKGTWNLDAMLLQGECLRAIGNLADANTLYTEILSYEPDSFAARLGLAHIQVENGDLAAAKDNYTRALTRLPPGDLADDTRLRLQKVEEALKHAVH